MATSVSHLDGRPTNPPDRPPVEPRQYVAIRYTQRLAEARAVASVGSTGDSYDNALAEAFNSLFKAELVRNLGPWRDIDDLKIATAEYLDWFNHRRLHGEIGSSHRPNPRTTTPVTTPRRLPSTRQFRVSTELVTRQASDQGPARVSVGPVSRPRRHHPHGSARRDLTSPTTFRRARNGATARPRPEPARAATRDSETLPNAAKPHTRRNPQAALPPGEESRLACILTTSRSYSRHPSFIYVLCQKLLSGRTHDPA
nr:hypothetical protein GCM10025730_23840 [Promicromonospora thailandica]